MSSEILVISYWNFEDFSISRAAPATLLFITSSESKPLFTNLSLNTSIEKICDFINPNFNKKIGLIKDIGAGAVSFAVISSLIILTIIYYPYLSN